MVVGVAALAVCPGVAVVKTRPAMSSCTASLGSGAEASGPAPPASDFETVTLSMTKSRERAPSRVT